MLLDWDLFIARTESGTTLTHMTVQAALMDLDQWAYYQRIGEENMPKGPRLHMVGWKSVLEKVGMSLGSIDRKKLISALEKDLDGFETAQAAKKTSSFISSIDPGELKSATKNLHATFNTYGKTNEVTIDALAAFYTVDHGGDIDENKALLRSVINHPSNGNVFSIGAGGAPKVRRLQSATGKTTGLDAFDKTRKPRKKNDS